MIQQLETIYRQKKQYREIISETRNKCVAIIYDGFVRNKQIKDMHKELYNATINQKKLDLSLMYKNSVKLVGRINKALDKKNAIAVATDISGKKQTQQGAIAVLFLMLFKRYNGGQAVTNGMNALLDDKESKAKEKIIDDMIKNARDNSRVFYLASEHDDSATDHRDYQGKIYVDENWQQYTKNEEVGKYIAKHNVKTLQWVMGEPVWFVTRPNCRHYFRQLPTDEVLSESVKNLIVKYNMHRQVGQRGGIQTLSHPRKGNWLTKKQNIEGIIAKYEDRLMMHEEMYRKYKSEDLKNMINKDKMLIKKWKTYLKEKFS